MNKEQAVTFCLECALSISGKVPPELYPLVNRWKNSPPKIREAVEKRLREMLHFPKRTAIERCFSITRDAILAESAGNLSYFTNRAAQLVLEGAEETLARLRKEHLRLETDYYVTARADGKIVYKLGPYPTREEAEKWVHCSPGFMSQADPKFTAYVRAIEVGHEHR